jgi:hypothetical protein
VESARIVDYGRGGSVVSATAEHGGRGPLVSAEIDSVGLSGPFPSGTIPPPDSLKPEGIVLEFCIRVPTGTAI